MWKHRVWKLVVEDVLMQFWVGGLGRGSKEVERDRREGRGGEGGR